MPAAKPPLEAPSTMRTTRSRYYERRMAQIAEENRRADERSPSPSAAQTRSVSTQPQKSNAEADATRAATKQAKRPIDALEALRRLQKESALHLKSLPIRTAPTTQVGSAYAIKPRVTAPVPVDPLVLLLAGRKANPVSLEYGVNLSTAPAVAWCQQISAIALHAGRHTGGAEYLRKGAIVDLVLKPGTLRAIVRGEHLYEVEIDFPQIAASFWRSIAISYLKRPETGLLLLKDKLPTSIFSKLCETASPLQPKFTSAHCRCTCPDTEALCKHAIAVLYGAAVLIEADPELLFQFRGVQSTDLLRIAKETFEAKNQDAGTSRRLTNAKLQDLIAQENLG